jgi:hypothetical protein
MPKTNKQIARILLIETSIDKLGETAKSLSFLARQAHLNKDFSSLSVLSEHLLNLSPQTENLGRYFSALSLSRYGQGDSLAAYKIFTELANSEIDELKSAALLAVGRTELFHGNHAEASRILGEAAKIAASNNLCAPVVYVQSQIVLSLLCAEAGALTESLKILQGIEPLVKSLGVGYPTILAEFWNNIAYGYMEHADLDRAVYYTEKAVSMTVSQKYPDWLATKQEIDQKLYEKNYLKLVSLTAYDRAQIAENVSQISSKQNFYICLDYYDTRYKVFKFITDDSDESEIRFTALTLTLKSLCVKANTGIKVTGYFSPIDLEEYQFQVHLERERLDDFITVMKNIAIFETKFPLKEHGDETSPELDLTTYKRIIEWVKSFADNGETLDIPTFENSPK